MGLLDDPPHTVTVQPYARNTEDAYGTTWGPTGEPVQVAGALQPNDVQVTASSGTQLQVQERFLFITRSWPWGPHTRVTGPDGTEYEQDGVARRYGMSERTRHDDVVLKVVGADG